VLRILLLAFMLCLLPAAGLRAQTIHVGPDGIYPDPTLTPGDVFDGATAEIICVPGYARSVRSVSRAERAYVFALYGLVDQSSLYELDHFISLELGGSNTSANLWPEPYGPFPGAHEKDWVENYLHDQVCSGQMALADAQAAIASDWYAVFQAAQTSSHAWYTSKSQIASFYYCDDDPDWQALGQLNLDAYPSVATLLARYPHRRLHRACLDGISGP